MVQLEDLKGQVKEKVLEFARQGDISVAKEVIEGLRKEGTGSSTTDLYLLCLKREVYRHYIQFCLDSAKTELDNNQLDSAERCLESAKSYALNLNGRDARNFLANGSPLYARLEELTSARA